MFSVENLKVRDEVLSLVPYADSYDYCDGGRVESVAVTAVTDHDEIELVQEIRAEYADRTPTVVSHATTVKEQLACTPGIGEVKGLIVRGHKHCSWEDDSEYVLTRDDFKSSLPVLDNGQDYEIYVPLEPIDWTKVRRRVEDRIRKDEFSLKSAAAALNVNFW